MYDRFYTYLSETFHESSSKRVYNHIPGIQTELMIYLQQIEAEQNCVHFFDRLYNNTFQFNCGPLLLPNRIYLSMCLHT